MIDVVAEHGWLASALRIMQLLQMVIQARWIDEPAIITLPHVNKEHMPLFYSLPAPLPELCTTTYNNYQLLVDALGKDFQENEIYQIHQIIREMPALCIDLSLEVSWNDQVETISVSLKPDSKGSINVRKDQEYILNIGLKRRNRSNHLRAHCPFFQKGKDEGWFLVLGHIPDRELWAMKRVSGINDQRRSHQLQFVTPSITGSTAMTFYLMSDCYIGLDQQYDIKINVTD